MEGVGFRAAADLSHVHPQVIALLRVLQPPHFLWEIALRGACAPSSLTRVPTGDVGRVRFRIKRSAPSRSVAAWLIAQDLTLFQHVARSRQRHSDALIPKLSRAANHSRLWLGIAAALAVLGGKPGRRAALRGVTSIGITSFVVNVPLKFAARRRRPEIGVVPEIRRLGRVPTSTSFPSGHSASAFAFATAAAQEMPALGVPLIALAGTVGYSRIYTGVHYPGDVVAGAAIGAGIATATRYPWPMTSDAPGTARPSSRPLTGSPADGAGLSMVVNKQAGNERGPEPSDVLRNLLPKAEIFEASPDEGLKEKLDLLAGRSNFIGVAGGDGTTGCAAEVALAHDKPVAVLPGGTLNHFASALGMETLEAAAQAVDEGALVEVDIGRADGRVFLNTASIGGYVEMVDLRERNEDRWGKWPAAFIALFRVLRSQEPFEVEIDGRHRRLWMLFVGNCKYDAAGFVSSRRDRLDDGLLDVRVVNAESRFSRTRVFLATVLGLLSRSRVYERSTATKLSVRSLDGPLRLACDGETFDSSATFDIEKDPHRLRVFAPSACASRG